MHMSAINYPMIERSIKELKHPSHKIFKKSHIVHISNKEI